MFVFLSLLRALLFGDERSHIEMCPRFENHMRPSTSTSTSTSTVAQFHSIVLLGKGDLGRFMAALSDGVLTIAIASRIVGIQFCFHYDCRKRIHCGEINVAMEITVDQEHDCRERFYKKEEGGGGEKRHEDQRRRRRWKMMIRKSRSGEMRRSIEG